MNGRSAWKDADKEEGSPRSVSHAELVREQKPGRHDDEGRATQAPLNCQPAEDTLADSGIRVIYPSPALPAHLVSCLVFFFFKVCKCLTEWFLHSSRHLSKKETLAATPGKVELDTPKQQARCPFSLPYFLFLPAWNASLTPGDAAAILPPCGQRLRVGKRNEEGAWAFNDVTELLTLYCLLRIPLFCDKSNLWGASAACGCVFCCSPLNAFLTGHGETWPKSEWGERALGREGLLSLPPPRGAFPCPASNPALVSHCP